MKTVILTTYRYIYKGDKFTWNGWLMKCTDSKDNGVHHELNKRTWSVTAEVVCAPFVLEDKEIFNFHWI